MKHCERRSIRGSHINIRTCAVGCWQNNSVKKIVELAALFGLVSVTNAFHIATKIEPDFRKETRLCFSSATLRQGTRLFNGKDFSEDDIPEPPITRERFYREVLSEEPEMIIKRKKKKGSTYRPIDNRDSLPFVVKDCSPDPYTKQDVMKQEAKRNTRLHKKKVENLKSIRRNGKNIEEGIASSVYKRKQDGTLDRIIGEFQLDKSTNCGDLLEVGENQYQVLRAKCQYKYAGGKRFIMVRKILEVKDITRLAEEKKLYKNFRESPDQSTFE